MSEGAESHPTTVLVVDDDPNIVSYYANTLVDRFEVRTADGGESALRAIDERIDVVLLDRDMPDRSGEEVLREIRRRGFDCMVAMVTAIEPDVNVVDMPFDTYVVKPVRSDELVETVESLRNRLNCSNQLRELYRLTERIATLETALDEDTLADLERYHTLCQKRSALVTSVSSSVSSILQAEPYVLYRDALHRSGSQR